MRLGLGSGSGDMYALLAQAGENALEISLKVERRFREYPGTGVSQEDVKDLEHAGDQIVSNLIRSVEAQFVTPYDREDIIALAFAIDEVPDTIENASKLRHLRGSAPEIRAIKAIEDEADRVARAARAGLFKDDRIDPGIVIRWKGIYEALEDAVDACDTAANRIGNILVKNA
jgi:uncharacterized protein Yka (UPF0111/DUF47 family)